MRIEVHAPMGAGKTTLVRAFAEASGWRAVEEDVDGHPFLQAFYKDKKFSFEASAFYIIDYLHKMKAHVGENTIFDGGREVLKSYFDLMTLTPRERAALVAVSDIGAETPPDLIIHLDYPPEDIMRRIRERARDFEVSVPQSYIEALGDRLCDNLAATSPEVPIMTIKAGEYDFVKNPGDGQKLFSAVRQRLGL